MLLVEDNLLAQRMIQIFVRSLGFQLDVASTGKEAVESFKPGKYLTVWMDIGLPDFDGYEVTKRMREMEKGTGFRVPVIGVSAHVSDNLVLNLETGLDAMLAKPLNAAKAKALLTRYGVKYKPS
jgi:DNA-binding response OmpR family regulator